MCGEVNMKNIINTILSGIYIIVVLFTIFYLIVDILGETIGWDFIK